MELHPATVWEAIADVQPDRLAVAHGTTHRTWAQLEHRAAKFAGALNAAGLRPGAKVGQLLFNSPEFVESYFGALKARAVPFNINYRYVADEVAYLLENADAEALIFHSSLSSVVAPALERVPLKLAIAVDDGGPPPEGCTPYGTLLANAAVAPRITRSADDITLVYTGGTTGMPKGVVTKVGAILAQVLESVPPLLGEPPVEGPGKVPALVSRLAASDTRLISLPASPLVHNTGLAMGMLTALGFGGTVVLTESRHFDPVEVWETIERERVTTLTIVGDPFARPLLHSLAVDVKRDLSSLRFISSSGAMFSTEIKTGLLELIPGVAIIDLIGASEGTMGVAIATRDNPGTTARFTPARGVLVLDDDDTPVAPGSGEAGRVALPGGAEGYFKDEVKSAATFRLIDGRRYTLPGDYATVETDGSLTLLGRGSACINTAGEKVFPEEVEEVLKSLPAVEDALVFGVDDERFGQRVVGVLSLSAGATESVDSILAEARFHLAGYKVPRTVRVVHEMPRTPVGKPDYAVARRMYEV
jgi:acyl-CoA synthetase (AMP-forming)/AMP-acid ligase II